MVGRRSPAGWTETPAMADGLVHDIFFPFKVPRTNTSFNASTIFRRAEQNDWKIGLWIDLTNTSRFYEANEIESRGVEYVKLSTPGKKSPTHEECLTFIQHCKEFLAANPGKVIGVHCTHGFNRTGYLVCAYLCHQFRMTPHEALDEFEAERSPGIYRQNMVNDLVRQFGQVGGPLAPRVHKPDWDA